MALYAGSTQESHWLMPTEEVERRRCEAVARGANPSQALSLIEEGILRRHHERRILRFVIRIGFPEKVAASAISYFKRFYLDHSVLEYNPSVIALSSLYASFKVEEVLMSADDLVVRANTILNGLNLENNDILSDSLSGPSESIDGTASLVSADDLLVGELSFLQSLKFHLICYHPYRSLRVLEQKLAHCSDLGKQSIEESAKITNSDRTVQQTALGKLMNLARRIVTRRTFFTDVQFTHSPAAIAIAAIVCAARELHREPAPAMSSFNPGQIQSILFEDLDCGGQVELTDLIAKVGAMTEGGADDNTVRELEHKRRSARDPLKDPTSTEFKQMQEAKQARRHEQMRQLALENKEKRRRRIAALTGFE